MKLQPPITVVDAAAADERYITAELGASAGAPGICRRFVAQDVGGNRVGCALLGWDDEGYWIDMASAGGAEVSGKLSESVVNAARLRGPKRAWGRQAAASGVSLTSLAAKGEFARAADCLWEAKQALRRKRDHSRKGGW